jgi:hypothetical protein
MNNFYEKYLKYKQKYLELKGGVIEIIPDNRLAEDKIPSSISVKKKEYIKLITIPDTDIKPLGSSIYKIQPYFSDIDINSIVEKLDMTTDKLVTFFIVNLKNILTNVLRTPNVFFSDFKAGEMHWTTAEIFAEHKNGLSLRDACKKKGYIKLDIIGPFNERYIEITSFFILKSKSGYVNINDNFFDMFESNLLKDIEEFKVKKPFKAIKRMWSLSKFRKDTGTLKKLYKLIKSNIALLYQIMSDLEVIKLLLDHKSKYNLEFVLNELNGFKEKLASILDIDFDEEKIDIMINNLVLLFTYEKANPQLIIEQIDLLCNMLLSTINKETNEYLELIGFSFSNVSTNNSKDGFLSRLFFV